MALGVLGFGELRVRGLNRAWMLKGLLIASRES